MKKLTTLLAAIVFLGGTLTAEAADLYVNKQVGKNSFDGSKEKPLKNLQKAIDIAADGDVIHVAEGNCYTVKIVIVPP